MSAGTCARARACVCVRACVRARARAYVCLLFWPFNLQWAMCSHLEKKKKKKKNEHIKWYTMMLMLMLMMVMLSIRINSIVMCRPVQSRRVVAMTWLYQLSSVQNGIHALGKAHTIMHSTPSLRGSPNVAFETVPVFAWLVVSRPFKEDRLALPLSTLLSSRRSVVWYPWLCARR